MTASHRPPTKLRETISFVAVAAACFSVLFFVVSLIVQPQEADGAGAAVIALIFGLGVTLVHAVFQAARRQWSFVAGVAAATVTLLALSGGGGWLVIGLNEAFPAVFSPWLHLIGAAAYGVIAATVIPSGRRTNGSSPSEAHDSAPLDDEGWSRAAGALLRERGDITDRRIGRILAEARASVDAEQPLADHFGSPAAFASKAGKEPGVEARRHALLYSAIAVWPSYQLVEAALERPPQWDWSTALSAMWFVAVAGLAIGSWTRFARERRDAAKD